MQFVLRDVLMFMFIDTVPCAAAVIVFGILCNIS
jgi:hypothetical protein